MRAAGEDEALADGESWVPAGVDTHKASIARVYDYWLGGTHNFLADRDAARALIAIEPNARGFARVNRALLGRFVRFLTGAGVHQFLDIGSGIPTVGNVHEIAQGAVPGARVVYVDVDPVAVAHSEEILTGNPDAGVIQADLRQPSMILGHPTVRRLIDFSQPVGLLMLALLHFVPDADDPWGKVATLRDALTPGSYVAISHVTRHGRPESTAAAAQRAYNRSVAAQSTLRPRPEIERFFEGLELVPPGVVFSPQWRPDSPADVGDDPGKFWTLAGMGEKRQPG